MGKIFCITNFLFIPAQEINVLFGQTYPLFLGFWGKLLGFHEDFFVLVLVLV
jgi:hypothetical protein